MRPRIRNIPENESWSMTAGRLNVRKVRPMAMFGIHPVVPAGAPAPMRIPSGADRMSKVPSRNATPTTRAIFAPQAAPATPISGAPQAPNASA